MNIEQIIKKHELNCKTEEIPEQQFEEVVIDGKVVEKHILKDGVRNGESIYYKNGSIAQRVNYKDGKIDGVVEIYKNGELSLIMNYKGEKPDGAMYIFENRNLSQIGAYKDNKKHGAFFIFGKGYLVKEENYKDDLLYGNSITYHPKSSNILEFGQYIDGNKSGIWKQFDMGGKVIKEEIFD
ncbi:toxin-antitoxin system YwqK family antitoxin [Candidatus Cytomitobacter primus]|uniref:Toxin-antitoxin system YwqK family antitoxin n=1 Tax=Candidatus Cytomitobacter primus TaxID=2066024 RepID=A0A5C0UFA4_9PROT|nr:hypothetical protein [Candidatus Cytomitobacter primus]QEK38786.1 hypothetical protein FZC34_02635 [Candidatus Cytomitobacter primus]